jgi:23S rRNA (uridine2552-2'-O)-methyltransferase
MRLDQARRDFYRKKAKKEGYKSRAAYKLMQIDNKYKIFSPKKIVIDFGCAPGGWLQYISKKIGYEGQVLGVDIKSVEPINSNVKSLIADINDIDIEKKIRKEQPMEADVITCDISPNLTGIWVLDTAKQIDFTYSVIKLFPRILKKNGDVILKVFQSDYANDLIKELKMKFKRVSIVKPPASRSKSSEIYLLCREYLGIE